MANFIGASSFSHPGTYSNTAAHWNLFNASVTIQIPIESARNINSTRSFHKCLHRHPWTWKDMGYSLQISNSVSVSSVNHEIPEVVAALMRPLLNLCCSLCLSLKRLAPPVTEMMSLGGGACQYSCIRVHTFSRFFLSKSWHTRTYCNTDNCGRKLTL